MVRAVTSCIAFRVAFLRTQVRFYFSLKKNCNVFFLSFGYCFMTKRKGESSVRNAVLGYCLMTRLRFAYIMAKDHG